MYKTCSICLYLHAWIRIKFVLKYVWLCLLCSLAVPMAKSSGIPIGIQVYPAGIYFEILILFLGIPGYSSRNPTISQWDPSIFSPGFKSGSCFFLWESRNEVGFPIGIPMKSQWDTGFIFSWEEVKYFARIQ